MSLHQIRRRTWELLSFPVKPGSNTDEQVAAGILHRVVIFSFGWQVAMIILAAATKPSDLLLECFGFALLTPVYVLQRRYGTAHAYAYWCFLAFTIHALPLFGPAGILSPRLMTFVSVLIGSAIVFPESFIVSALVGFGTLCTVIAALQHFGYWAAESSPLPVVDAVRVFFGRSMNFTVRMWFAFSAYQAAERVLLARTSALLIANREKRRILEQEERLFWNLSHELNSPLARLKLYLRSQSRQAGAGQGSRIPEAQQLISDAAVIIRQALQLAQLRHPVPVALEERVDLADLLQDLCRQTQQRPEAVGVSIQVRALGVHCVRGSAELLRTAFDILLQQALRGAHGGEVSVLLKQESASQQTIRITCSSDPAVYPPSGAELLSPEDLAFRLATEIAAAHGGQITRNPADEKHTLFRFSLPAASLEPTDERERPPRTVSSVWAGLQGVFSLSHLNAEQCVSRSLNFLLYFLCLWGPAVTMASILIDQDAVAAISGVLVVLGALVIRWIHRTRGLRPAFIALQVAAIAGLLLAALRTGGIYSPASHSIITLSLAGIVIFRKRYVVFVMLSLLAGYSLMSFLQSQGLWAPARLSYTLSSTYLFFLLNVATTWFLLLPSIYRYRWANKKLDQQLVELEAARTVKDRLIHGQRELYGTLLRLLSEPIQRLGTSLDAHAESGASSSPPAPTRGDLEAAQLQRLMRQLAVLAELRTERLPEPSHFDLWELLKDVCGDASFEAGQTGRTISYRPGGSCSVIAPQRMLRASFENIIRNAIRFTPPGTPVEVAVAHTDSGRIRVTVEDHGPGVPEEMLTRIFEPFVRLDAGLPAPVEGVGLGLSIAKYTVEGCGGKISAFNRYGGGLQVVVELPGQPDVAAS